MVSSKIGFKKMVERSFIPIVINMVRVAAFKTHVISQIQARIEQLLAFAPDTHKSRFENFLVLVPEDDRMISRRQNDRIGGWGLGA